MQTVVVKKEKPHGKRTFTRRIGSTNYRVGVHFSGTSRETFDDKILRLIRNEVELRKVARE